MALRGSTGQFVACDVTTLSEVGIGSGFKFIIDFECFNHLNDSQRIAAGKAVNKITVPDATMLMLVWEPGRRRLLPQGASPEDIESAFTGWKMIDGEPYAAQSELPGWLKNIPIHFYRFRKKEPLNYCSAWYGY